MAKREGPVKVHRYTTEFKLKAVKLSSLTAVDPIKWTLWPNARGR